ncbi:putative bifunctional diguanylate cyclase/phosphodiesterase [Catenovulum sediminis]|uniref:EAL domain-containing protein n=1 Tax=Catenovulum sediminis TaxID=1740262 RepID=A0ABV1RDJ0_9ALTE|nr:bifunctional diguanylate cyclase/phosphodiesterase [Catenovulum sediminis]
MHRLLQRLIKKYPAYEDLMNEISVVFEQSDEDRRMLELALQLTSDELNAINHRLQQQLDHTKNYQTQIQIALSKQKALLNASPEAVFSFASSGHIDSINRAGCEFFNMREADIRRLSYSEILRLVFAKIKDGSELYAAIDSLKLDKFAQLQGFFETHDGNYYEYNSSAEIAQGRYIGRVWCCRDISEIKQQQDVIQHQAFYDGLTGLPNRILLKENLQKAINRAKRSAQQVAVLFIDLDDFKKVNDSEGHSEGDLFLVEVANRLQATLKDVGILGRLGGDEFLVIIEAIESITQVEQVSANILAIFSERFIFKSNQYAISASIGISVYPDDGSNVDSLISKADMSMYQAKRKGKNTYCCFNTELEEYVMTRVNTETRLYEAIRKQDFVLHFQPKIDLQSGWLHGVEALIRWQPEGQKLIYPDGFIALAEEIGIISQITEIVVRQVCEKIACWQQGALAGIPVSINISAIDFSNSAFMNRLMQMINESGVDTHLLEFELTETALFTDLEHVRKVISELKAYSIGISIDDFGTGYSSFSYLQQLDIDYLKIDKSFIQSMKNNEKSSAIIKSMIDVARNLGLKVVAEGIEDENDAQMLCLMGCHLGQGYVFAKPCDEKQLEMYVKNQFRRQPYVL